MRGILVFIIKDNILCYWFTRPLTIKKMNPNILSYSFVPLYVPQIRTWHISTHLINSLSYSFFLFHLNKNIRFCTFQYHHRPLLTPVSDTISASHGFTAMPPPPQRLVLMASVTGAWICGIFFNYFRQVK